MAETKKELYEITEGSKKKIERYPMIATREEIRNWLKMKREVYGYIEGVGGDKSYYCYAVLMR